MAKWISVDERLPDSMDNVLICFEAGGFFRRRMVVGYWWERAGQWGPNIARRHTVTHWMPLPKLPKVARKKG